MMENILSWFPFYYRDWELSQSIRRMGPIAQAYFLRLLCVQFQEGFVPSDPAAVQAILTFPSDPGGSFDQEAVIQQVLRCFIPDGDGRLVNRRMVEIRAGAHKVFQAKSRGGRSRARENPTSPAPTASSSKTPEGVLGLSRPHTHRQAKTNKQIHKDFVRSPRALRSFPPEDLAMIIATMTERFPSIPENLSADLLADAKGNAPELNNLLLKLSLRAGIENPAGYLRSEVRKHFAKDMMEASRLADGCVRLEAENHQRRANGSE